MSELSTTSKGTATARRAAAESGGAQTTLGPEAGTMKRAVIYIRVSTKAQAVRDGNAEGYSLPTQREACLRRAQELGAVVVEEYVDKDTATSVHKRPSLLRMVDRVSAEKDVDYVIVHQLSRFARYVPDDACGSRSNLRWLAPPWSPASKASTRRLPDV